MQILWELMAANKENERLTQQFVYAVLHRQPHTQEQFNAFVKRTAALLSIALLAGSAVQIGYGMNSSSINNYLCDNKRIDQFACDLWRMQQQHPNATFSLAVYPCWMFNNSIPINDSQMCRGIQINEGHGNGT
jgi:hypothetical protein